jgi:hypothetical protein
MNVPLDIDSIGTSAKKCAASNPKKTLTQIISKYHRSLTYRLFMTIIRWNFYEIQSEVVLRNLCLSNFT